MLIDRVGTKTFAGTVIAPATTGTTADAYWSIAGKGQSGRTGIGEGGADVAPVAPVQKLASMYRGMVADTTPWGCRWRDGSCSWHSRLELDAVGTPERQLQTRS